MLVVISPQPAPSEDLLARYLVAAELLGLDALIIANKQDLDDPFTAERQIYQSLGYLWLQLSAKFDEDLATLEAAMKDRTSVIVGQSGVGKSTLARRLSPQASDARSASISSATGKGRHTTTTTRLYHCHEETYLIDSPGVWEYGLWRMDPREVVSGFREIRELAAHCKFRDCLHVDGAPGCAVLAALATGEIHPSRYSAYERIIARMRQSG